MPDCKLITYFYQKVQQVGYNQPFKRFQVPPFHTLTEKIAFSNQSEIVVIYSPLRRRNFGDNPKISFWVNDGQHIYQTDADIQADAEPPNQTQYTIRTDGATTGFIQLNP